MKNTGRKQALGKLTMLLLAAFMMMGCSKEEGPKESQKNVQSENVIITETGDILYEESKDTTSDDNAATNAALSNKHTDADSVRTDDNGDTDGEEELSDTETTAPPKLELVEPEQEQVVTEEDQKEPQGNELQLVFLGDSIFDTYRDGTGVPYLTAYQCGADVYNLAMGGTCAAIAYDESGDAESWTSNSLVGVVKAMMKEIPTDVFEGRVAKEILDNPDIDFSKTDYFIVEYGMNDFLSAVPLDSLDEDKMMFDMRTYTGALRYAASNLKNIAPDATVILCAPTYAQFYNGNWMIGDGNSVNNGYGTLFDYKGICNYVANEQQVVFFNAYQDLGIDGYTAEEYLEDGIHLTEAGRRLYADALANVILKYEETKNN